MKLLLTSAGISNKSIENALFNLVEKKPENASVVFVPAASNVETGDKSWLIKDLFYLKNKNFKSIYIADISAVPEKIWKPQFENADILFFEGGNPYHLMEWINKSGLILFLPEFLKTKVYVGVSAGSMVLSKDLALKISQDIYEEDLDRNEDMAGLNFVDFYFLPHLNSFYFKNANENFIKEAVRGTAKKIYAMDDNSALKITDEKAEIVSEGKWFTVN